VTPLSSARRLSRRLAALPDGAMRRAVMAEQLDALGASGAIELLVDLRALAPLPAHPEYAALETFGMLLAAPGALPYELLAELYAEARARGADDLARFLLDSPAALALAGGARISPDPKLADVPLGVRKQLARSNRRDKLERLFADPEPLVIRQLLQNPKVTEADVVRMAARRPAVAGVLRELFRAERWIRRYAVKRTLVMNPYTPGEIAARLLPLLRREDLRAIAVDPTLHARVRADALTLAGGQGRASSVRRSSSPPPTRR